MPDMTQDRLKELFYYNQQTGQFVRKFSRNGSVAGTIVGHVRADGYVSICADGKHYKAHRLAWLYVHGKWPEEHIDHKDRCKFNNRIENLRAATRSQNKANSGAYKNNQSGFKGAHPVQGKWQARISVDGKCHSLGYYPSASEANAAYLKAARSLQGEFARGAN